MNPKPKHRIFIILLLCFFATNEAFPADVKLTELPAASSLATTDILPVVVDPGGTPVTKKATITVLSTLLQTTLNGTFQPLDSDLTTIATAGVSSTGAAAAGKAALYGASSELTAAGGFSTSGSTGLARAIITPTIIGWLNSSDLYGRFTPTTLTANRVWTVPNVTGTVLTTGNLTDITATGTVTSGTWSGSFGAVSGANLTTLNASNLSSGTVAAARMPALTGDVTTSAGSVATTLANSGVTAGSYTETNATIDSKGRVTAATNGAQVRATDFVTTIASASDVEMIFTPVPCVSGKTYRFEVDLWMKWGTAATSGPAIVATSVASPSTPSVSDNKLLYWIDSVGTGGSDTVDNLNGSVTGLTTWRNFNARGFFTATSSADFNYGVYIALWDSGDVVTIKKGARLQVIQVD